MSLFIVIMPSAVLSDRPPESKVMPLPTRATVAVAPPGGLVDQPDQPGRLGRRRPPRRAGRPAARTASRSSSHTSTSRPASKARSVASAASRRGVIVRGGSLTQSRARATASADLLRPGGRRPRWPPTTVTVSSGIGAAARLVAGEPVAAEGDALDHRLGRRRPVEPRRPPPRSGSPPRCRAGPHARATAAPARRRTSASSGVGRRRPRRPATIDPSVASSGWVWPGRPSKPHAARKPRSTSAPPPSGERQAGEDGHGRARWRRRGARRWRGR